MMASSSSSARSAPLPPPKCKYCGLEGTSDYNGQLDTLCGADGYNIARTIVRISDGSRYFLNRNEKVHRTCAGKIKGYESPPNTWQKCIVPIASLFPRTHRLTGDVMRIQGSCLRDIELVNLINQGEYRDSSLEQSSLAITMDPNAVTGVIIRNRTRNVVPPVAIYVGHPITATTTATTTTTAGDANNPLPPPRGHTGVFAYIDIQNDVFLGSLNGKLTVMELNDYRRLQMNENPPSGRITCINNTKLLHLADTNGFKAIDKTRQKHKRGQSRSATTQNYFAVQQHDGSSGGSNFFNAFTFLQYTDDEERINVKVILVRDPMQPTLVRADVYSIKEISKDTELFCRWEFEEEEQEKEDSTDGDKTPSPPGNKFMRTSSSGGGLRTLQSGRKKPATAPPPIATTAPPPVANTSAQPGTSTSTSTTTTTTRKPSSDTDPAVDVKTSAKILNATKPKIDSVNWPVYKNWKKLTGKRYGVIFYDTKEFDTSALADLFGKSGKSVTSTYKLEQAKNINKQRNKRIKYITDRNPDQYDEEIGIITLSMRRLFECEEVFLLKNGTYDEMIKILAAIWDDLDDVLVPTKLFIYMNLPHFGGTTFTLRSPTMIYELYTDVLHRNFATYEHAGQMIEPIVFLDHSLGLNVPTSQSRYTNIVQYSACPQGVDNVPNVCSNYSKILADRIRDTWMKPKGGIHDMALLGIEMCDIYKTRFCFGRATYAQKPRPSVIISTREPITLNCHQNIQKRQGSIVQIVGQRDRVDNPLDKSVVMRVATYYNLVDVNTNLPPIVMEESTSDSIEEDLQTLGDRVKKQSKSKTMSADQTVVAHIRAGDGNINGVGNGNAITSQSNAWIDYSDFMRYLGQPKNMIMINHHGSGIGLYTGRVVIGKLESQPMSALTIAPYPCLTTVFLPCRGSMQAPLLRTKGLTKNEEDKEWYSVFPAVFNSMNNSYQQQQQQQQQQPSTTTSAASNNMKIYNGDGGAEGWLQILYDMIGILDDVKQRYNKEKEYSSSKISGTTPTLALSQFYNHNYAQKSQIATNP